MLLSLRLFCYLICSLPCTQGAYFVRPSIDYNFYRKCIPELFPVYIIPNSSFSKLVACSLPARRNSLALLSNDINKLTSRQTALNSPLRARKGGRQNLHYLTESYRPRCAGWNPWNGQPCSSFLVFHLSLLCFWTWIADINVAILIVLRFNSVISRCFCLVSLSLYSMQHGR